MRLVVVSFLALLLAGLSPARVAANMADEDASAAATAAAAAAAESSKQEGAPVHMRPHDKVPARGPIMTAPMAGGKQDVTGSNDANLSDISEV